jgi:hypothetical protein
LASVEDGYNHYPAFVSRLRQFVRVRFNFDGTLELLMISVPSKCSIQQ